MKLKLVLKVIAYLVLCLVITVGVVWKFIKTEQFSKFINKVATAYIDKNFDGNLKFEGIEINLFPPGIAIRGIDLDYDITDSNLKKVNLSVKELLVEFNFYSLSATQYSISTIEVTEARAIIKYDEAEDTKREPLELEKIHLFLDQLFTRDIIKKVAEVFDTEKYSLDMFVCYQCAVQLNDNFAFINFLSVEYSNAIRLGASMQDIRISTLQYPEKIEFFEMQAYIDSKKLDVERVKIQLLDNIFEVSLQSENIYDKDRSISGSLKTHITMSDWPYWDNLPDKIRIGSGQLHSETSFIYSRAGYKVSSNMDIENLKSSIGNFQNVKAKVDFDSVGDDIVIDNGEVRDDDGGRISLTSPLKLYNLASKRFYYNTSSFDLSSVDLSNALFVVPNVSSLLNAKVSGKLDMQIKRNSVVLSGPQQLSARDFKLQRDGEEEILALDEFQLLNSRFEIIAEKGVSLNGTLVSEAGEIEFGGEVLQDKIDITASEAKLDIGRINNIAGLDLKGVGGVSFKAYGKKGASHLDLKISRLQNFQMKGYGLGTVSAIVKFHFDKGKISLKNAMSEYGSTLVTVAGGLQLRPTRPDLNIFIKNFDGETLYYYINPLVTHIDPLVFSAMEGVFDGRVKLGGSFEDNLEATIEANATTARFVREDIRDINVSLALKNRMLVANDISFKKGSGNVAIDVKSDLTKKQTFVGVTFDQLSPMDFNFYQKINPGLYSELGGYVTFNNELGYWLAAGQMRTRNTKINAVKVEESWITVSSDKSKVEVTGKAFGDIFNLNSRIYLPGMSKKKDSFLNFDVDFESWSYVANLFSSHELDDPLMKGKAKLKLKSKFNIDNLSQGDIDLDIDRLSLNDPRLRFNLVKGKNSVKVKDGDIKHWDIEVKSNDGDHLYSKASGKFSKMKLAKYFSVDLRKVSLILGTTNDLMGKVSLSGDYSGPLENLSGKSQLELSDFTLSLRDLPRVLEGFNAKIGFSNNVVSIDKIEGNVGIGRLNVFGDVSFAGITPVVNIQYDANRASVYYKNKTQATLSGKGLIAGRKPPYVLGGNLVIHTASIQNEIEDFLGDRGPKKTEIRFLPDQSGYLTDDLLAFNLSLISERAINVKNSLLDLQLMTNMNVTGGTRKPALMGSISLVDSQNSFVYFKNNAFQLAKVNVNFTAGQDYRNPLIDIMASSTITDYKVTAKVFGPVKSFNFELSSDPFLSQQNILSLIAFGYAEDMTESMSDADKESLSSAGIGSFVFDQLKINEKLQENLGLQLNVGTEFMQDRSSLLEGRTRGGGGGVGRVRSAAKLELKKRFSKELSMSVSSTVGGSLGQQQSMNVNYEIKKNLSVEGVYEMRTAEENEAIINNTSAGADLKFNWTFK